MLFYGSRCSLCGILETTSHFLENTLLLWGLIFYWCSWLTALFSGWKCHDFGFYSICSWEKSSETYTGDGKVASGSLALSALSHGRNCLTCLLHCLWDVATVSNHEWLGSHITNTRFLLPCFNPFTSNLFVSVCLKVFLKSHCFKHFIKFIKRYFL